MFFSFSSSAKGQTTQTTPLIEASKEKTREFQTQLLHYFSKSDNKSNHHHHKALFVCVSGPCFVCALVYFCSRGDMSVGTNKRHPVSSRPCRGFLHAHTRTHWDKSSFLHACMLACYPACCCHLLPPPATSAAAACFAKTRPEVARVRRPSWGEILGNQTLAWLVALWSTNPPRFTRGINPLE